MKSLIFATYLQVVQPQIINPQVSEITEQERNRNIRKRKLKTFGTVVAFTAVSGGYLFWSCLFSSNV